MQEVFHAFRHFLSVQLPSGVEDVILCEGHQVLLGDGLHGGQTVILGHQNVLEDVPHATGVAEGFRVAVFLSDVVPHQLLHAVRQLIAALFALHLEDIQHLVGGVVLEEQKAVEAGFQSGIGVDEPIHQIGVARYDDHQIVPVILHGLEDGVDGLLTEVVLALTVEGIGLVDEQHAAQRLLDDLLGLDGGLAHIPGHQTAAVHLYQLALGEDVQTPVDPGHHPGHHGLAGAGVAGEHHVQGHIRGGQVVLAAKLVDGGHVDEVADLLLDGGKADVAVQLRLQVLHVLLGQGLHHLRFLSLGGRLTAGGQPAAKAEKTEVVEPLPKEDMKDLQAELDSYIGLATVKEEVRNLINMASVYKLRRQHDLPTTDMSLHMVFTGNPGTGKTMMARMMARIYRSLDILSKGQLVEVDRSGLVAGYVGQTAIKTQKVIQKALGGVLFIDEAYALNGKSENDFGQEAIDTILKAMEDHRDDLVVIVAGYTDLMDRFIHSNPGLESRFNRFLLFEDYTSDEMLDIFKMQCKKGCYQLSDGVEELVRDYITEENGDPETFGNARGVRNIFEHILVAQNNRLAAMETVTKEDLMTLTQDDVLHARGKLD